MVERKGEELEKWNWQVNAKKNREEEGISPNKRQLVSISEDEDTALEASFIRVDAEVNEEKQFNVITDDYKRKRVRFNSN